MEGLGCEEVLWELEAPAIPFTRAGTLRTGYMCNEARVLIKHIIIRFSACRLPDPWAQCMAAGEASNLKGRLTVRWFAGFKKAGGYSCILTCSLRAGRVGCCWHTYSSGCCDCASAATWAPAIRGKLLNLLKHLSNRAALSVLSCALTVLSCISGGSSRAWIYQKRCSTICCKRCFLLRSLFGEALP